MTDWTTGITPLYPVHKPPYTIESPGAEKKPDETTPRRHPLAKDGLINTPAEGVRTVFDLVTRSARIYPNHQAVGTRKLIKLHKEKKKVQKTVDGQVTEVEKEWQFFELSPFSYITYKEYETLILQVGAGLRKIGLDADSKLHIYGATW